jgi:pimeloyl-ACP methyl ester carboxylesterase
MPSFSHRGQILWYELGGQGFPLVLVHGWGASSDEWSEYGWTSLLAPLAQLVLPDVLGHGRSSKPHSVETYTMEALASDLLALLDTTGIGKADVFGYSMGGAIALWLAALWPDRVRNLVTGAPSGSDPEWARALGRALRTGNLSDERVRIYHEYALRSRGNDVLALAACLESGLAAPPCEALQQFSGPALVSAGDEDRRFEASRQVAQCLPGATFLPLAGADHMAGFGDARLKDAVVALLGAS